MSELEYVGLVLEDQLLDHLATPEGAKAIWRERLPLDAIPDSEDGIRDALAFVMEYMDEFREPPAVSVLSDETGYDEFNEPQAPVEYVINKLRDRYKRKEARAVITKMGRLSGDPDASIAYGLGELTRLKVATAERGNSVTSDNMFGTIDDYRIRLLSPEARGITFGYDAMDDHLNGLRRGEVTVILARPKRYKSWQLLKSAHDAFVDGRSFDFATMELSEEEMRDRFMCMAAEVNWDRFQHRLLLAEEEDRLEEVAQDLKGMEHKFRFHRPKPGDRNVHYLSAMAQDFGADVMYVDQLSWFDGAKDEKGWSIIGKIMEQLKDAAQNFPIYMAAQYNRTAVLEEGIADIASIGLADFIGQTADNLLGIYASKDMHNQNVMHLGVVESRAFQQRTWEVKVELTHKSNFKLLNTIDKDHDKA